MVLIIHRGFANAKEAASIPLCSMSLNEEREGDENCDEQSAKKSNSFEIADDICVVGWDCIADTRASAQARCAGRSG